MLEPNRYYETEVSATICCGECWQADIDKTNSGKLVGDEAVYEKDLTLLPTEDAYQCDDCLKQSDNYDDEIESGY